MERILEQKGIYIDIADHFKEQLDYLTIGQTLYKQLGPSEEKEERLDKINIMIKHYKDLLDTLLNEESIKEIANFLTLLLKEQKLLLE